MTPLLVYIWLAIAAMIFLANYAFEMDTIPPHLKWWHIFLFRVAFCLLWPLLAFLLFVWGAAKFTNSIIGHIK